MHLTPIDFRTITHALTVSAMSLAESSRTTRAAAGETHDKTSRNTLLSLSDTFARHVAEQTALLDQLTGEGY